MKANETSLSKESNALYEGTIAVFDALIDTFAQYAGEGSIELKKHSANFTITVRLERKEEV